MTDLAAKRARFRKLHESGCFVLPNPWDIGSALVLQKLGFPALATTSSGFANSRGLADGAVPCDLVLAHAAEIAGAVDVPVNADFENGYADDPAGVAANVRRCVATGVAGLSIEDNSRNPSQPLYELPLAVERIRAAREAIGQSGVLLTARAECFLTGHSSPLEESIRRLRAYAEAGADVLYAPGVKDREGILAIVAAVAPKPVNILIGWNTGLTVAELGKLGVNRISTGGALARAALTGFLRAARGIAERGEFSGFEGLVSSAEVNGLFRP
jgi:2-methylisocitrate lyase-like PEP mutase family enzyme